MDKRGTEGNPFQISSVKQLQAINKNPSAHYELLTNINAQATREWNDGSGFKPIGSYERPFTGTFQGNNHEITNLFINRPEEDYAGLFGCNHKGCIKNVCVKDATISGRINVGGLVGKNSGIINFSYMTGDVSGKRNTGGLVGYNMAKISIVNSSYAAGDISGMEDVGGLTGVNSGSIESSYSIGDVCGDRYVGGLSGSNSGDVESSYCVGDNLVGYKNSTGCIELSFAFCSLDERDIERDTDLVLSRNNCEILYIADTSTLYLKVDNQMYSCSKVPPQKVHGLAESPSVDIVETSEQFRASRVAI